MKQQSLEEFIDIPLYNIFNQKCLREGNYSETLWRTLTINILLSERTRSLIEQEQQTIVDCIMQIEKISMPDDN
jgi:hypothetical protein